jgi:hypothetical protein
MTQPAEEEKSTLLPKEQQTLDAQKDWDHPEGYVSGGEEASGEEQPTAEQQQASDAKKSRRKEGSSE